MKLFSELINLALKLFDLALQFFSVSNNVNKVAGQEPDYKAPDEKTDIRHHTQIILKVKIQNVMNDKEKVLEEFRAYCVALCPLSNEREHWAFRRQRKVEILIDNRSEIESKFRELVTKYRLKADDIRNDFRMVIAEVFEIPTGPASDQSDGKLLQVDRKSLLTGR